MGACWSVCPDPFPVLSGFGRRLFAGMSRPTAGKKGCSGGSVAHRLLNYTHRASQIKFNNLTTSFTCTFFFLRSGNLFRMLPRTLTDLASASLRNLASAIVADLRSDFIDCFPRKWHHTACCLSPNHARYRKPPLRASKELQFDERSWSTYRGWEQWAV